jgi:G:T-mismatch repair DNA endonuclease (very short patch repair protein)
MYIKKQSQHLTLLHGRCLPADRPVHSRETRSYNMSRIKGKNTKPEMLVRKFLHANGLRYKLHDESLILKHAMVF